jgi:hypothetical protein
MNVRPSVLRILVVCLAGLTLLNCQVTQAASTTDENIKSLLDRVHQQQNDLDGRLVSTGSRMAKQGDIVHEAGNYLATTLDLITKSRNAINSFRQDLHTLTSAKSGDPNLLSAQLSFASLEGSLSVYGLVADPVEGILHQAQEVPNELITGANLLNTVRKNHETWFSGVDSLQDNVNGLVLVRSHYVHAFEFLDVAFNMAALQVSENGKTAGKIVEVLTKFQSSLPADASSDNLKQWTSQELKKIQPVVDGNVKTAPNLAETHQILVQGKSALQQDTAWLDDLLKETKHFKSIR